MIEELKKLAFGQEVNSPIKLADSLKPTVSNLRQTVEKLSIEYKNKPCSEINLKAEVFTMGGLGAISQRELWIEMEDLLSLITKRIEKYFAGHTAEQSALVSQAYDRFCDKLTKSRVNSLSTILEELLKEIREIRQRK